MTFRSLFFLFISSMLMVSCGTRTEQKQSTDSTSAVSKISTFTLGFYNVENLFDTLDHPDKYDESFTPSGRKNWTAKRYAVKLEKLSKVIASIDPEQLPWGMGLCEIENKQVVEDLIAAEALQGGDYGIVHHESPDERGIDNAFIYRKDKLQIVNERAIHTPFDFDPDDQTRDILYVKVQVTDTDEFLHIFINHWPSRSGGMEKSEPKRVAVAAYLKAAIDSVMNTDPTAKIISMGDYNDEPNNTSVTVTLGAKALDATAEATALYNLAYADFEQGLGSYHYWKDNDWNMIDQAIVNGNFYQENSILGLEEFKMYIFKPDWLLHTNDDGSKVPNKTYGKGYYGGYSDHLPVYLRLRIKK